MGAAATAAVAALGWGAGRTPLGVHGAGAIADPLPILRELARRGVRAAAFDGSAGRAATPLATDAPPA